MNKNTYKILFFGLKRENYIPFLFVSFYLLLVVFSRYAFFTHMHVIPDGDMAADDILIFRAKSFHLFTGNYSRVGFNHPGPFFLQVAAIGELIFHDFLHIFPSYAAAQVFGLALMQGVALALAFRLWLIVTRDVAASIAALGILVATISAPWDTNIFVVPWNPHSYVAGAMMLATGLTGLWVRGLRWAPLAALGAVSLVHGHASFIGLVPAMLAVFAVLIAVRSRAVLTWDPLTPLHLVRADPWPIVGAAAIVLIGAAPIAANLALHWPGDFPSYFGLAHSNKPHGIRESIRFVLSYMPLAGAWLLLFLLPSRRTSAEEDQSGLYDLRAGSLAVCAAGVLAALFYAWRGIDDLSLRYLIIWVGPFIGVAAGTAAIWFTQALDGSWRRGLVALVATVACLGVMRHKATGVADPAEAVQLERTAAQIRASTPTGEKIALDLDPQSPNWVPMWTETAAVTAILQRQGSHAVCIDNGWHILFTREYRCSPQDHISRRLFLAAASDGVQGQPAIAFYKTAAYLAGRLSGLEVTPGNFGRFGIHLDRDWSDSEGAWVWSDGPRPVLTLNVEGAPKLATLTLKGMVYSDGLHPQTVTLDDEDGHQLATSSALDGDISLVSTLDLTKLARHDKLVLRLAVANPVSPKTLGRSADPRELGFGLKSVQLTPSAAGR